ncbi:putative lipoprotein [Salmonella phage pertopsoe]|uniref:Putative lipoprotein n=1 Tax=Salmonella phage pertopsoe TaxID=2713310 RepID=A0A6G8RPC9_9CAUD|nr:putative lipoprotein [Salmonella phage pertopsoe]QIO03243.1 putative lipoprotein [Salmonella phage pertopsoe]
MFLIRGFRKWIMTMIMVLALTSCRIFVTSVISVTDLWDPEIRTIPVNISADIDKCNKNILNQVVTDFQNFQTLQTVGCFDDNNHSLRPYWKTTIPLLRKGDEGKIPYLSASIYYSQNNSIIVTFNPSFFDKLRRNTQAKGVETTRDVAITFQIVNNTKSPIRIATQGVFVNGSAVGNEMNIYEIRPGGKVWIRMSDVGVNSLVMEGIEPVGVLPARH